MRRVDRRQLVALSATVCGLHVLGAFGIWWFAGPRHPTLVGLAALAYSFGLRHAFDADHIAAIDNTTRRLMAADTSRRPLGVGLFFSLGHSSVVLLMTIAIAATTRAITFDVPRLHAIGQFVGTTVSGLFLYLIGILNLIVMVDIYRVFRQMRRGDSVAASGGAPSQIPAFQGGAVTRWFGSLFRLVSKPWHMYLIGFLFGLGFDTATEIGLLTTAGLAASQALPLGAILCLPIAFAAGMSLMDTADGVLMCGAYGWAFTNPLRKVFYNLTVTGMSVVVALFIGTIELVTLVSRDVLHLHAGAWQTIQTIDVQTMGYIIVGLFVASWIGSAAVWRWVGTDATRP